MDGYNANCYLCRDEAGKDRAGLKTNTGNMCPRHKDATIAALRARAEKAEAEAKQLREAMADIGSYTGDGRHNANWREIVKHLGAKAREALAGKGE